MSNYAPFFSVSKKDVREIVVVRVNCGGSEIVATDGKINWNSNSTNGSISNSIYSVNTGNTYTTSSVTYDRHDSIPNDIPDLDLALLYEKERYDYGSLPEMLWTFGNLNNGRYKLRIYVGEYHPSNTTRTFNVYINGVMLGNNLNITSLFGNQVAGMIEFGEFQVSTNEILLEFEHVGQNPQLNAIEILKIE